jgi:uncharacterized protein YkwD
MSNVKYISMGDHNMLITFENGDLLANGEVQSGITAGVMPDFGCFTRWAPGKIMENVERTFVSNAGAYAIKTDGSLWSWGLDLPIYGTGSGYSGHLGRTYGQNQDPGGDWSQIPGKVLDNVVQVAHWSWNRTTLGATLFLQACGAVWQVGVERAPRGMHLNDQGGSHKHRKIMDNGVYIATGMDNWYVIDDKGNLWVWGGAERGLLGNLTANPGGTTASLRNTRLDTPTLVHRGNLNLSIEPIKGSTDEEFREEMLRLINVERRSQGQAPVTLCPIATAGANVRAKETETLFEHRRPNGQNPRTVMPNHDGHFGENMAEGLTMTPKIAMDVLIASPGHRRNINRRDFTKVGIGIRRADSGHIYWVQIFTD